MSVNSVTSNSAMPALPFPIKHYVVKSMERIIPIPSWSCEGDLSHKIFRNLTLICSDGSVRADQDVLKTYDRSFFHFLNHQSFPENKDQIIQFEQFSKSVVRTLVEFLQFEQKEAVLEFSEVISLAQLSDYLIFPDQHKICLDVIKQAILKNPDLYVKAWLMALDDKAISCDPFSLFLIENFSIDALSKMSESKQKELFNRINALSTSDHPAIQHMLGFFYHYGFGVQKNLKKAVKYYKKAVVKEYPPALNNLAYCYQHGEGVVRNPAKAVRLYRLSAGQGNARAQNHLAFCFKEGVGVVQNAAEAVRLYRLSAGQGNALAQNNLANCFENGIGVVRDVVEAVRLYRLSVEQGDDSAQNNLGCCYLRGHGVEENSDEGERLLRLAAAQGNSAAKRNLANMGLSET